MLICVLPINENTVTYIFTMARWQMLVKTNQNPQSTTTVKWEVCVKRQITELSSEC